MFSYTNLTGGAAPFYNSLLIFSFINLLINIPLLSSFDIILLVYDVRGFMMDYYNLDCNSCFRGSRDKNIKQYLLKNIDHAVLSSAFEVGETDYLEKCLCDHDIKEGDLYISSDDFIFVAVRLISAKLSSFIEYCNHCKGHYIDARVEEHVKYAEDPETARPLLYSDMGEIGR